MLWGCWSKMRLLLFKSIWKIWLSSSAMRWCWRPIVSFWRSNSPRRAVSSAFCDQMSWSFSSFTLPGGGKGGGWSFSARTFSVGGKGGGGSGTGISLHFFFAAVLVHFFFAAGVTSKVEASEGSVGAIKYQIRKSQNVKRYHYLSAQYNLPDFVLRFIWRPWRMARRTTSLLYGRRSWFLFRRSRIICVIFS